MEKCKKIVLCKVSCPKLTIVVKEEVLQEIRDNIDTGHVCNEEYVQ